MTISFLIPDGLSILARVGCGDIPVLQPVNQLPASEKGGGRFRGDPVAYFAARMLEYYGGPHGKVYHGGIDDWKAAGKPVTTTATRLPPVALSLNAERVGTLWTQQVIERARAGGANLRGRV